MKPETLKEPLRGLLIARNAWPQTWGDKDWEGFAEACSDWQLSGLLFYRLRESPSGCPQAVWERLRNRFELTFAHWGRLKAEVGRVSQTLLERGISFGFLKGYPLALNHYPHPACRSMQDVDLWVDVERFVELRGAFQELGYSALSDQSSLEKKPQFIKLHGNHVFAFECHRSLHTSYLEKIQALPEDAFDGEGFPKVEILFLSVLLHHKFFESAIRDLVDLHFLTENNPNLDWEWIEKRCCEENLQGHLQRMAALGESLLNSVWPKHLKHRVSSGGLLLKIKKRALFRKKKRGLWEKFCDAALIFFVYDRPVVGARVLWNKYVRHVRMGNYFKMGLVRK